jgi:hypothetical protein
MTKLFPILSAAVFVLISLWNGNTFKALLCIVNTCTGGKWRSDVKYLVTGLPCGCTWVMLGHLRSVWNLLLRRFSYILALTSYLRDSSQIYRTTGKNWERNNNNNILYLQFPQLVVLIFIPPGNISFRLLLWHHSFQLQIFRSVHYRARSVLKSLSPSVCVNFMK